jgi:HlyD family secretion protein
VVPEEPLLRQSTQRAETALARARAEEAAALAALAEAEAGPRAQDIAQGRARLEAARSARQTARHELDRLLSLVERSYASRSALDVMQGRYDEAVAREAEAQAALDELIEGTRSEAIDQARNRYAAAAATVQDLEVTLQRATVRSPVAGVVDAMPYDIGERPTPGNTVAVVLDSSRLYARVHVPADVRNRLHSGAGAEVRVDGYPDPFPGTLRWVASDAAFTPYYALNQHDRTRLSYVAEVDITGERADRLPIGVPVQVTFPELAP